MNIPIFKLQYDEEFKNKYAEHSKKIFESDSIIEGGYVKLFEDTFAKLVNAKHCIAVNNCTTALEIALNVIDVRGKKVLIPTNTFFATAIAVQRSGGIVELIDADMNGFAINLCQLKNKISTNNVGAVILVHIGGIICDHYREIKNLCDEHKVCLIEDAAHAHLSSRNNVHAGTIGDIGCFSFFPTKVMTTGGGGMLTTNNDKYAEKIRSLKDFGRDLSDKRICINPGGRNGQISEFHGLLGFLECERAEERIKKRQLLMKRYEERLKVSSYKVIKQSEGNCCYYKCILETPISNKMIFEFCKNRNVNLTGCVYDIPVHKQPVFSAMFNDRNYPISDYISEHHICPPLYPELTLSEIDYICDVLLEAQNKFPITSRIAQLVNLQEVNLRQIVIEPVDIIVKIEACGICGSDLHYFKHGGLGSFKQKLPICTGHEPAGIVVFSNSLKFPQGTRVVIEPNCPVLVSKMSQRGKQNLCEMGTFIGATSQGAFADYINVKEHQLEILPSHLSFEVGVLLEPLGIALHAIKLSSPTFLDSVVIYGCGCIGICLALLLRKMGVKKITMVDVLDYRIKFIKNTYNIDAVQFCDNEHPSGTVVYDAAGTDKSIDGCLKSCEKSGKVCLVGIPTEDYVPFNPHVMRTKELQLVNVRRSNQTLNECLSIVDSELQDSLEKMVTHKFELENIQTAFDVCNQYKNVIKCIITMNNAPDFAHA